MLVFSICCHRPGYVFAYNLSQNKSVTASGHMLPYVPQRAVDGMMTDATSRWYFGGSSAQSDLWLMVDLGHPYRINRWRLFGMGLIGSSDQWGSDRNPRDFRLQGSTDGTSWFDADVVFQNTASTVDRVVPPFSARCIRLYFDRGNQWNTQWVSVLEFEVHGEPDVNIHVAEGKITGTQSDMHYSLNGGGWLPCQEPDTYVTFTPGHVYIQFNDLTTHLVAVIADPAGPPDVTANESGGQGTVALVGAAIGMEYSTNGGLQWSPVTSALAEGAETIDVGTPPDNDLRVRVAATAESLPSQMTGRLNTATDPNAPARPVLIRPSDQSVLQLLTPAFETGAFQDPQNEVHASSIWQISTDPDAQVFEANLMFELETDELLTTLQIPDLVLDTETAYYWRVKFINAAGLESSWSEAFSFITPGDTEGIDDDGIPDNSQISGAVDLDRDGTDDNLQTDSIKSFWCYDRSRQIGVKKSTCILSVDKVKPLDPRQFTSAGKPAYLPFGLLAFRMTLMPGCSEGEVIIFFSEPLAESMRWHKLDPHGWYDYSTLADFDAHRTAVTLTFQDGDTGDADGVINHVIVDPSGPGSSQNGINIDSGGCFILACGQSALNARMAVVPLLLAAFLAGVARVVSGRGRL